MGFPIRKSSDQSSFAAPQGLSQRTTSFIASQRQGIHRMLLRHLITLMIDVRRPSRDNAHNQKDHVFGSLRRRLCLPNTPDLRARSRPRWSPRLGSSAVRCIPSSRFQTSRTAEAAREAPRQFPKMRFGLAPQEPEALVEPDGIEPTTSCLQSTRSPN